MSYTVWGEELLTADMTSGTRVYLPWKPTAKNYVLSTQQFWFIAYNNPTFTSLSMDLYSTDENSLPKKLIASSTNSQTKLELMPENQNHIIGTYFNFNNVSCRMNELYAFVPRGTSYTYSESSCLLLMKAFPNPVYETDHVMNAMYKVGSANFMTASQGAEL